MYKSIKFYVSDHFLDGLILHAEKCKYLPDTESRAFIGSCYSPRQAMTVASSQYTNVRYCPYCLNEKKDSQTSPVKLQTAYPDLCKSKKPKRNPVNKVEAVKHFPSLKK